MGENLIMFFYDFATAGEMTNLGGPGGQFVFYNSSSAGSASFDIISTTIQAQCNFSKLVDRIGCNHYGHQRPSRLL